MIPPAAQPSAGIATETAPPLVSETEGRANDEATALLRDLVAWGASTQGAINAVAALVTTFGTSGPGVWDTAALLTIVEEGTLEDNRREPHLALPVTASRMVTELATGLGLDWGEFQGLVVAVFHEGFERSLPPPVVVAGLSEHGYAHAAACEGRTGAPCPVDEIVGLVAEQQQGDYERRGHIYCDGYRSTQPECVPFAECASAYDSAFDAQDEAAEARGNAEALHARSIAMAEEGYADEDRGIRAAREAEDAERRAVAEDEEVAAAWQEHELCIAKVYGATTAIAYRAFVPGR